jgi:peptide/nickel transport system permease protein
MKLPFCGRNAFLVNKLERLSDYWKGYRKNKSAVFGLISFLVIVSFAITADLITKYGPMDTGVGRQLQSPSSRFPMGTDDLARDIFSGVVQGSRVSLLIGFTAAFAATVIGVVIGSISGYSGGAVDELLMRVCEVFQCMPRLLFALVIVAFFGNDIWNVVVVIGILSWPRTARLIRSQFLQLREMDFVLSARAIGVSNWGIIFKQILPSTMHIIVVAASFEVATAIIMEAGLSFLGAGDPNVMSWGCMLHNAQSFLRRAWWMAVFPGMSIFLTTLSLNLIGDGLNDAFNPKLRGTRAR